MLEFETALERVLSDVTVIPSQPVAAELALGRVLHEPMIASSPIPRFDTSAMDGYAVRAADSSTGCDVPVIGEARTGAAPGELVTGSAMRIFTGAALPVGADAVVMQERVARSGDVIRLELAPHPRDNVRALGEDLAIGAEALPAGARVGPGASMLAASLDLRQLVVSRRPRVAILCTGDELRAVGAPGSPGLIPESNSPGLRALAERAAAEVVVVPLVVDSPSELSTAVKHSLEQNDLLVTVGGVSVGDHDYVRRALEQAGVQLNFWKVAIKPGKPLAYGRLDGRHVLALPGNPASALVTFALFGLPLLRAMQGDSRPVPFRILLPCSCDVKRNRERLIVSIGTVVSGQRASAFKPHRNQSSGSTVALAASDGLALIERGDTICEQGTMVPFMPWSGL